MNLDADEFLVETDEGALQILRDTRTIAVLGIKTEQQAAQPAFFVPRYLQQAGYEIIPVPVYYPGVNEILGEQVFRTLASIPRPIDLVVVFRRPKDLPPHLDDFLAKQPAAVWLQSGIRHPQVARSLAEASIRVVQDRCTMIDHQRIR
jgi:uncharacterized protein